MPASLPPCVRHTAAPHRRKTLMGDRFFRFSNPNSYLARPFFLPPATDFYTFRISHFYCTPTTSFFGHETSPDSHSLTKIVTHLLHIKFTHLLHTIRIRLQRRRLQRRRVRGCGVMCALTRSRPRKGRQKLRLSEKKLLHLLPNRAADCQTGRGHYQTDTKQHHA